VRAFAFSNPVEFLERAGPLLLADEARHNLILSLAWLLHERPEIYPEFRLWLVEEDGRPLAAALITPPFNLVLADAADDRALPALAAAVRESGVPVPGVVGNRPTVDCFNEVWAGPAGVVPRLHMGEGVLALERVADTGDAPGAARRATPADRALVLEWNDAFAAEALPHETQTPERVGRMIDHRLNPATDTAGFWLWEASGAVVSLVGYGGATPGGGIRLGPVYTPSEHRRRGYGTSLVAAVSTWLLAHGRTRCCLYTDLANPTSNSIYRRIGYRQVAEAAEYGYEPVG
jgi:RimJ/RimL family protein N-acetyltransferase